MSTLTALTVWISERCILSVFPENFWENLGTAVPKEIKKHIVLPQENPVTIKK